MRLATVILAAGQGSRMGRPKQTLPVGETTLLLRVVELGLSLGLGPVIVVTGAHRELVESHLVGYPVRLAHNENWATGMGSSIGAGTREAMSFGEVGGLLVLLTDQPTIDRPFLQPLLDGFSDRPSCAVATAYPTHPGVPAVFPAGLFPRLLALDGQRGARSLLAGLNTEELISIAPASLPPDLDTPEAYAAYERD